jgi:uncharacterized membrane protein YdbT with pleckstrin-like domain
MDLRADERVLFEGRPSWRALMTFYVGGLVLAAVVIVVLGFLVDEMGIAIAIAAVIVALTLLIGFLRRVGTKYLLTTQRLRISRGIVRKNVQETRLDRVQNVNYSQGVLDRIFGVGTVDFDTAGTGTDDADFRFEWIDDPESVVRSVDEATHAASQQPQALEPPAAPGPTAS